MPSEAFIRKRKMLLIVPLFFTPFLCLLFWALGGGKGYDANGSQKMGINMDIPQTTDGKILQKDQAYRKLLEDSLRKLNLSQNDNYLYANGRNGNVANPYPVSGSPNGTASFGSDVAIGELRQKMERAKADYAQRQEASDYDRAQQDNLTEKRLELAEKKKQLEDYLAQMRSGMQDGAEAASKTDSASKKRENIKQDSILYTLSPMNIDRRQSRFYDGSNAGAALVIIPNTISCVIANDQTVINGSVVKLRLTEDTKLAGTVTIPKNTFLYGIAQLSVERLNLMVNSITYQGSIYPIKLEVYDLDGLLGISTPGGAGQAMANQGKTGVANAGLSPLSNGLFINQSNNAGAQMMAQAGSAVLQAGQGILSKKLSVIKVFVKANYHILLKQSQ